MGVGGAGWGLAGGWEGGWWFAGEKRCATPVLLTSPFPLMIPNTGDYGPGCSRGACPLPHPIPPQPPLQPPPPPSSSLSTPPTSSSACAHSRILISHQTAAASPPPPGDLAPRARMFANPRWKVMTVMLPGTEPSRAFIWELAHFCLLLLSRTLKRSNHAVLINTPLPAC